ncbi:MULTISPECIES: hypothetical protein [unclassified Brevibacterium]|uniref:hypothetical protein n=1 Tax=unclassified Brevibacterium TaxID=2614124 RepID=UPI001E3D87FC|nr:MULTISPECIES: hypothetical protein [unclassified Brevibacterium]MCD1286710.1 hypothetical protein [Brevibacterium sp. CCUG 69071]MDK8434059.1 hypothetical protein [Brevibacterium sp. H-BE7]
MKKRLILLAGLGVGFILGSRTGRQSYERLKAQAQDLWTDPRVQDTVEKANQSIREKSPAVADAVQDTVEKVNAAATGVDSSVSEFDGDEDGSASTSGGPGSASTSSSNAPSTGAASPGANAASTGAGASASSTGSAKSGSGSAKSASSSTGSNAAKSSSSKSSVPKPSEVKHDPHAAGAAKSQDTLADPERSLDDEGPAGVSSED